MTSRQVAKILASKRAAVPLVLILIVTSAAFAVTSSILFSVQATASAMLGESSSTIVVAQANSRAPFLGTLPLGLAESLTSVEGVRVVSPEVFAPSTLMGQPVMVRGVEPYEFMQLQDPTIVSGSAIAPNDTSRVMVGATLAREMGLSPGSEVTLVGGVRATVAQVTVAGVFSTGTTLDNEVVAPLSMGDWLRGIDYGVVSILRLGVDQSPSQVAARVQQVVESSSPGSTGQAQGSGLPVSSTVTSFAGHVVEASPDVSSSFFSKTVGLSQENVLLISALVFVSMSVAIVCALQEAVFRSRNDFGTLRTLGMSSRRLGLDLVLVTASISAAAAVGGLGLGWGFLALVARFSPVRLAFYAVDPLSALPLASLYSVALVTAAGLVAAALSSTRFRRPGAVYEMTLPYLEAEVRHV